MKKKVTKEEPVCDCGCGSNNYSNYGSKAPCGGVSYILGVIGAAVYFIAQASTFWLGVLGLLKALVWPAFMVYGILQFLGL